MNEHPGVFDAHVDTLLRISDSSEFLNGSETHVDAPRLAEGGCTHLVMAICSPAQKEPMAAWVHGLKLFDELKDYSGCRLLLAAEGCQQMIETGEIPADLAAASLTWNGSTALGGGIGVDEGLTDTGRKLAAELHDRDILLDVSHLCDRARFDLLSMGIEGTSATHCNCRRLRDIPRNLPDDDIREIASLGGVVGITFVPDFLSAKSASTEDIVSHVEHAADVAGIDHVGFGSDFDGVENLPAGVVDCSSWNVIIASLKDAGWNMNDIEKVTGGNWRRVFGVKWEVSR